MIHSGCNGGVHRYQDDHKSTSRVSEHPRRVSEQPVAPIGLQEPVAQAEVRVATEVLAAEASPQQTVEAPAAEEALAAGEALAVAAEEALVVAAEEPVALQEELPPAAAQAEAEGEMAAAEEEEAAAPPPLAVANRPRRATAWPGPPPRGH